MTEICDYDILVSHNSNVKLQNTLRYWLAEPGISNVFPSGIYLRKTSIESEDAENPSFQDEIADFMEFNDYSFFLSLDSFISAGKIMNRNFVVNQINTPVNISFPAMVNSNAYWLAESGVYHYACQILWDEGNRVLSPIRNGVYDVKFSSNGYLVKGEKNGVLLTTTLGLSIARLRFYRRISGSEEFTHYVDVPICGVCSLYDNGLDVNGYKWNQANPGIIANVNSRISSLQFLGNDIFTV